MSNKKTGNAFEKDFCDILASFGFWAYNFPNKTSGQPADIIASRNKKSCLIDCKVCENDSFDVRRIEENQSNAMNLWKETGNGCGYFALKLQDGTIRMVGHHVLEHMAGIKKVLNRADILVISEPFDVWERWFS